MKSLHSLCRTGSVAMALVLALPALSGCQLAKNQLTFDRSAELDRQDYRDALAPVQAPKDEASSIPDFQPVMSTPDELKLPSPLVTVSVNNTVSLRDLMFDLANEAGVDLELDPQVRGSIIFTAKEKPFNEVVERICEMAGLRYKFQNDVLRVELDRPYVKSYKLDYVNNERQSSSSMKTAIQGDSTSASDTGSGQSSTGSSFEVSSKNAPDLWKEINDNLEQILTAADTYVALATTADPVATPVNPNPPPPLPVDPNAPKDAPPPMPLPGSPQVAAMPAAAAPTLNITASPTAEPLVPNPPSTFSVSKQTGLVSVFATERQHKMVQKFFDDFRKMITTQVLIEAKVLQVDLNDTYASGIDWGAIKWDGFTTITPANFGSDAVGSPAFTLQMGPKSGMDTAVKLLSTFGTVRALSSPRVTALNNQAAAINVSKSVVFYDLKPTKTTTTTSTGTSDSVTYDPERHSAPEGVLLNILPSANPDTGEVYLSVRPTVTKKIGDKEDPTGKLICSTIATCNMATVPTNNIPLFSTQEIDSLVKLQSGQIMVMGGLMKDENTVNETGIPLAGDIPLVGALFRGHTDAVNKSELVIFLKATVIPGSNVDETDRKMYKNFGLDRHPAKM